MTILHAFRLRVSRDLDKQSRKGRVSNFHLWRLPEVAGCPR
jgi:hypothetical protein